MKKTINYDQLWQIEQDIQRIINESPAMALLMTDKFSRFINFNRQRLEILQKTMRKLHKKYIVHDENDRPIRIPVEDQPGVTEWSFLPAVLDECGVIAIGIDNKTEYYKAADEFLKLSFDIEI